MAAPATPGVEAMIGTMAADAFSREAWTWTSAARPMLVGSAL